MTATTTANGQIPVVCKDKVRSISPKTPQVTSSVGIFGRWSRRTSPVLPIAPSTASSITSTPSSHVGSCDRCEELKIQSDINQSMLNECAISLKAKEADLETSKIEGKKLQAQLDTANQANAQLRLEQMRFNRELQLKDDQLAGQAAESTLLANTCNELTAQLTQQYKELTDAHNKEEEKIDTIHASFQQELACHKAKLEAKDQEIECLQDELKEQKDAYVQLSQDVAHETAKRTEELRLKHEKQLGDVLAQSHARIAELEAETGKLYAQLSIEVDWDDGELALDEVEEVDDTARTTS